MKLETILRLIFLNIVIVIIAVILYSPKFCGLNPFDFSSPKVFETLAITFWLLAVMSAGNAIILRKELE